MPKAWGLRPRKDGTLKNNTTNELMSESEWAPFLAAYRNGVTADMVQIKEHIGGEWSAIWTFPPCSPTALEQAARQIARCRAARVRHVQRARLILRGRMTLDVIVVTETPPVSQEVRGLHSGRSFPLGEILASDILRVLTDSASPMI